MTPLPCLCAHSDLEKSVEKIQKDLAHNHRLIPVQELEEKAVVLKQLGETLTDLKGEDMAGSRAGWQVEPARISLLRPHMGGLLQVASLPLGLPVRTCWCVLLHPQGRFPSVPVSVVCPLQALGCCRVEGSTPRSCCLPLFALLAVQVSPVDSCPSRVPPHPPTAHGCLELLPARPTGPCTCPPAVHVVLDFASSCSLLSLGCPRAVPILPFANRRPAPRFKVAELLPARAKADCK